MLAEDQTTAGDVTAKEIFALALPALGVLAAMPLYLLLDTAVVGRLGAQDLAALGAATTIQSTVTTQLTFLSYGTTARASRLFGAGKRDAAIAEGVQATWVGLGVGLIIAIIMWFGAGTFAQWLTGDPETAAHTARWLNIAAVAIPCSLVTMAGNGWLRGIQNTRLPLYFTLAGVVPGAIAIPLLVSQFGIAGSAIATVLGMGITASCFLIALAREHKGSWRPRWQVIVRQLTLGRDLILRSLAFQVSFLSAASVAARFGTASLAAHQVMLQLWNFISLVLDSLAIAAQTLTGAALGRGSARVAKKLGTKVTAYSVGFAGIIGLVFALGARVIPRLFTTDAAVLDAIAGPWWLMIVMIVIGGVVFALDGVLLGAGDAAYLRTITIASVLLGFLPGVWLSYLLDGGLVGIWLGLCAFIGLRGIFVWVRFNSMKWAKEGV